MLSVVLDTSYFSQIAESMICDEYTEVPYSLPPLYVNLNVDSSTPP